MGLPLRSFPPRYAATGPAAHRPVWARGQHAERQDDPGVCVEEVPGQLGLFAPWPRAFTRDHGRRIGGRDIPGLGLVLTALTAMAAERGVSPTWLFHTGDGARLALASRPPTDHLVAPETLADLPQMRPTLHEALKRAGLLDRARPRLVPAWWSKGQGSCHDCLAWTNENVQRCTECEMWRYRHPTGCCHRCERELPLHDGYCRRCVRFLAETAYDIDGIALEGADQLWFGGPYAPRQRTTVNRAGEQTGLYGHRRLQSKRRSVVGGSRTAARPVSEHLGLPGQLMMFHLPRDWTRLDGRPRPPLTPAAQRLVEGFSTYIRARGWSVISGQPSLNALRLLLSHLGVDAPIHEADIRLLARREGCCAPRVINYLRSVGLLVPDAKSDAFLASARRHADDVPAPFRDGVHRWIDVLCNTGSQPSLPLAPSTVCGYVRRVRSCLQSWHEAGIDDLRAITRDHVQNALAGLTGEPRKGTGVAIHSFFRALKREKLIFRDPARNISLTTARPLPRPMPDQQLAGALDRLPQVRNKLSLALAAVHALSVHDQRGLLLDDLHRSRGQLTVRRTGRLDHIVYLDELTHQLITAWLAERHRRWPAGTNPHLLVTAQTCDDDTHPRISSSAINTPLRRIGLQTGRLRADRILDEARHTEDPVHLIRLFGLAPITAMRYLNAAHPERSRPLPIAP
ncbi:tyrosine-type recombinase/integrase [Streptomyces sp. NBC_01244]|uniref:tyrosine-type recombinase/integrase n=1 Tax=Streptomyces sp. NBC_01244 TaxID=2903797 RepID=UPI002E0DA095|nr:hypothetical protein OG247_42245 [Streptomyces sp. NBC_01244]